MYHQVGDPPPGALHRDNWTSLADFEAQLDYLAGEGYRSIALEEWLDGGPSLPARPLVITFDDGYRSVQDLAWPLVRRHGFGATTFLVAGEIGGTNRWDAGEVPQPLLDADDVARLSVEGMRFGSHGWSHRPLRRIGDDDLKTELVRSRAVLTELLGAPVQCISYPYSSSDARVLAAARDAGYRVGVTGRGKINPRRIDPLGLRRVKPGAGMSMARFRRVLFRERCLRW